MRSNRASGFALLEALVAIVLVASVGSALFALVNTSLQSLARAEAHALSASLQPHVLAWVRTADLSELSESFSRSLTLHREGRRFDIKADFVRSQGPGASKRQSGERGIHLMALYNVQVEITEGGRFIDRYTVRRVGSQQVAPPPRL